MAVGRHRPPAGTGYTVGFAVYQIGTLITTGALGEGFLPGALIVAVFVGVLIYLCGAADKKLAAEYTLREKK